MTMNRSDLERALLQAHEHHNSAELIRLYTLAGDMSEAAGDLDACCFYLTHAFVFALEAGSNAATELNARLVAHNRAVPLPQ